MCTIAQTRQAGLLPQKVHCLAATKSPFCPLYTHNYATLLATHEIGNDFRAFATISASLCYAMLDYSLSTTYIFTFFKTEMHMQKLIALSSLLLFQLNMLYF